MVATYIGKPQKSIEEMYKSVKKCKKPKCWCGGYDSRETVPDRQAK
jgi:hypothetical protein